MKSHLISTIQIGFVFTAGILLFSVIPARAAAQTNPGPYKCYRGYLPEAKGLAAFPVRGGGTLSINGFTIEVKADPNPDAETVCHAIIRSQEGPVVFQADDDGMDIDSMTGKDVNGDGEPDAVVVGYSGGAHCCWTYHFVSLGPKPALINTIENEAPVSFEDIKGDGQVEILVRDGSFDYFEGSHATSPFPLEILRLEGSEFKDVGSDFLDRYDAEIEKYRNQLTPTCLDDFLHSSRLPHQTCDDFVTKGTVLQVVLDYLYSGRTKEARKSLEELWPSDDTARIRKEIVKHFCPGAHTNRPGSVCTAMDF